MSTPNPLQSAIAERLQRDPALRDLLNDPVVHRALLMRSFRTYAMANLRIHTKADGVKPFVLNSAQVYLDKRIDDQLKRTGKVRLIVLKGRQQGISTYVEGRFFWKTSTNKGLQAYILTHEQQATDNIFAMARRFYDYCPSEFQPETQTATAKELFFNKLDSGYKVGTAGNRGAGRSSTVQLLHGSEVSRWPSAEEHFAGIMQAVPQARNTEIILESTANGVGGKFYDLWQEARRGESEFEPVFIPWFWQTEYVTDAKGLKFDKTERTLAKLYTLSNEQLAWRRKQIALLGESPFNQEYPCTQEDAFILTGRMAFDGMKLKSLLRECYKPKQRMTYSTSAKEFVEHKDGELRVWDRPNKHMSYVLGADVAEGLAHKDYSCIDVLDQKGRQVAQWHGHIAPDILGDLLAALGTWYNTAYIGVERNNHGLTTLTRLRDLYYPLVHAERELDDRGSGDSETKRFGWLTTSKSKPLIIDHLAAELRNNDSGIVCADTINEMMTYRVNDAGQYGAQSGCHDDRVMARAIAGQMLRSSYLRI